MFDYGDIISHLEELIESIEHDEITLAEIQKKLQYLVTEIEDNWEEPNSDLEDFTFDDLG
jgi:hypothetical protein